MLTKKITGFAWWNNIKNFLKWSAYIIIVVDGISDIMRKIEGKDLSNGSETPANEQ